MSSESRLKAVVNEDGAAILDIEHDSISTLNPTGAFVWQGLERGEDVDVIVSNLARKTGEDPVRIEGDVKEFVADLERKRLLPR